MENNDLSYLDRMDVEDLKSIYIDLKEESEFEINELQKEIAKYKEAIDSMKDVK